MKVMKYKTLFSEDKIPQLVREGTYDSKDSVLNNPEKIVKMMRETFQIDRETEEYVYEICLDSAHKPIAVFEISHGTVNASMVSPREFYQKALLVGAAGAVAVHNHPSGDCTPSREDDEVALKLKETGHMLGISLVDFIIVGDQFCSYAAEGWEKVKNGR